MSDVVSTASSTVSASSADTNVKPGSAIGSTGTQNPPINQNSPSEERYKIKVNNQEREYSLTELKTLAAKAEGADERFRSASEIEKKAKAILDAPKGKVLAKTLMEQGYTKQEIRQILEEELTPFVEEDMMSPEELERKQERARLKDYEDREKSEKDTKERSAREERESADLSRELTRLNDEFLSAIEKVDLPRDPFLGKMVAQYMISAEKNGYSLSVEQAAEMVSEQYAKNTQHVLKSMSVEKLKQVLGKDTLSKLRESDVQAVKNAESPFTKQAKQAAVKQDTKPSAQPNKKEATSFFNKLRGVNYNKE